MKMKVDMRSDKRKGKKFKTESASALQLKPYGANAASRKIQTEMKTLLRMQKEMKKENKSG